MADFRHLNQATGTDRSNRHSRKMADVPATTTTEAKTESRKFKFGLAFV